jgi:hypothetical protein
MGAWEQLFTIRWKGRREKCLDSNGKGRVKKVRNSNVDVKITVVYF